MADPIRLALRDTGLHDDLGGPGQRIWTTAGRGYETTWFVEEAPYVDVLRRCAWEIENLQQKLHKGEQEGWEGSKRRAILREDIRRLGRIGGAPIKLTTINEVR